MESRKSVVPLPRWRLLLVARKIADTMDTFRGRELGYQKPIRALEMPVYIDPNLAEDVPTLITNCGSPTTQTQGGYDAA